MKILSSNIWNCREINSEPTGQNIWNYIMTCLVIEILHLIMFTLDSKFYEKSRNVCFQIPAKNFIYLLLFEKKQK